MPKDHDPELPAGFQDSDLEMAELTATATREARLRKKGICSHGWTGPIKASDGITTIEKRICHHCGRIATEAVMEEERREALI